MELEKILTDERTFVYVENEEQIKQYAEKMKEYGIKCNLERIINIFNNIKAHDCVSISANCKECSIYRSNIWVGDEKSIFYTFDELFNEHPIFKSEKEILEYCYNERTVIKLGNQIEISMFIELYNRNMVFNYPYKNHDEEYDEIYIRLFPYYNFDDVGCKVYGFNSNFEFYERERGLAKQIDFEKLYGWLE